MFLRRRWTAITVSLFDILSTDLFHHSTKVEAAPKAASARVAFSVSKFFLRGALVAEPASVHELQSFPKGLPLLSLVMTY
jgi:hypothetical protein